ncbi:2TM domain-containing protein [Flavobacterium psychrophilum]|uniref:2TM domain-containing protein n=4 Tax=Flavobacterium psychrophilum TaxID=96345 RepID=A6H044_FLAPJ|nr:2TM domain-containing protein [Flavobacterium psychrophilum]AIG30407.1 hypothetical protein IA03_07975 [Flavobacterium psychrophilum]AIG32682.1 hypothetical protein IA01_08000 [Flavobacterium psychrophilum]AIG34837.1 hypothetical protein IA02_07385 [Flavobacterium psychrophilum]AIG37202.1 hypothetical protein IA04_07910 [Flavobacterium psychrophilum]AIG39466.1 hypothetical protein IA05_07975 [Flavobacterium psychrophilum]
MKKNQNYYQNKEILNIAQSKVARLKGFYIHTFVFSIGVIIFVLKEYFKMKLNFFPIKHINYFAMAIWIVAYLISVLGMFFEYKVFGEKWEDQKIKNMIKKQSEKTIWR